MNLATLCDRFDVRLRTAAFEDIDSSANGLQVGTRSSTVEHVAFAVDAAQATIEAAAATEADLLVVHHGISWGGIDRISGRTYDRIATLLDGDIALYVSHLPLDAHPELGNAAGVASTLGVRRREGFGKLGTETIGLRGSIKATHVEDLAGRLETLDHGDGGVTVLPFGPDRIRRIAIVTGSGADWFDEAVECNVDAFITGEGKGHLYHDARESAVTVILAGHYATETFGVRSMMELAANWGLETTFIDHPTGL